MYALEITTEGQQSARQKATGQAAIAAFHHIFLSQILSPAQQCLQLCPKVYTIQHNL